jgi:hypothetical protein
MDVQELGGAISSPVVNGPPEIISRGPSLKLMSNLSANAKLTQAIKTIDTIFFSFNIIAPTLLVSLLLLLFVGRNQVFFACSLFCV